jgi:hypothetical protein
MNLRMVSRTFTGAVPMKNTIFLLLLAVSAAHSQGGRLIENPLKEIPRWVRNEFSSRHFDERYSILFRLYPHALRGDFNGDGRRDVAIQIEERSSGRLGIAIFHAKKPQELNAPVTILGAGKAVGKAGADFKWVEVWSVIRPGSSAAPQKPGLPEMGGDALRIGKRGGTSGLIYRDGKKYSWYSLAR